MVFLFTGLLQLQVLRASESGPLWKMENFTKGEVKELDDPYPFCVDEALQMRITQGSKIRNVMGFAMKKMAEKEVRQIAWNGSGTSVTKTITCAEIMKRKLKVFLFSFSFFLSFCFHFIIYPSISFLAW